MESSKWKCHLFMMHRKKRRIFVMAYFSGKNGHSVAKEGHA